MKVRAETLAALALVMTPPALAQDYGLQDGAVIYGNHCLNCHQADGRGVPFLQPSLVDAPRVTGDDDVLIRFMLEGSQNLPPEERQYDNVMSGYAQFSDVEVAAVINYLRAALNDDPREVSPEDVARVRAEK